MALFVGKVTGATTTSFTAQIIDALAGDEFYVGTEYFSAKPARQADIVLTGPDAEITFEGLEPDGVYFWQGYRGETLGERSDYVGFFDHWWGYTLAENVTPPTPGEIVEAWDNPVGHAWQICQSNRSCAEPTIMADDGIMGSKFLRMNGTYRGAYVEEGYVFRSKAMFLPGQPFTVETVVRAHNTGNYTWGTGGFVYCSEAQYFGITWTPNNEHIFKAGGNTGWVYLGGPGVQMTEEQFPVIQQVLDRKYILKTVYDGGVNVDCYVDDVIQKPQLEPNAEHTFVLPHAPTAPFNIYIASSYAGAGEHWVDYGEIKLNGATEVCGFVDTRASEWDGNFAMEVATEGVDFNLFTGGGGITAPSVSGQRITFPQMGWGNTYKAGAWFAKGPMWMPRSGQKHDQLNVIGNQAGDGEARVRLLDADDTPIDEIMVPGNATGFIALTGEITVIDTSAVTGGYKLEIFGNNNVEGASAAPKIVAAWATFDTIPAPPPPPEEEGNVNVDCLLGALTYKLTAQLISGALEGKYCNFTTGAWVVDYVAPDCDKTFEQEFTGLVRATFNLPATGAKEEVMITIYDADGNGAAYPGSVYIDGNGAEITELEYMGATFGGGTGTGSVLVDHTTNPELLLTSPDGNVGEFTVRFYLKADYDAGNRAESYRQAWSRTLDSGGLAWPVALNPGTAYTAVATKQGYMSVIQEVTTNAD